MASSTRNREKKELVKYYKFLFTLNNTTISMNLTVLMQPTSPYLVKVPRALKINGSLVFRARGSFVPRTFKFVQVCATVHFLLK